MKPPLSVGLILAAGAVEVLGRAQYTANIPNGDNLEGYPALGHITNEGGTLTSFGKDYGLVGKWTLSLCSIDSDGDGLTNGQELGDPCCVWKKGAVPNQTSGLSHPGLATSVRNITEATVACPESSAANRGHVVAAWLPFVLWLATG